MARKILHLDLDAFFCAVEELLDPSLAGKAFAVGGDPDQRGVVSSCSYEARYRGIHSAMPMAKAVKLCPDLIIVHGHYRRYSEMSRQVMAILHDTTPLVQQISIDEAFLDMTDLPQSGEVLAKGLQARIRKEVKLPCSIGVASNKLVAKTASDVGKRVKGGRDYPNAITVVPPGEEAAFLAPLPTEALWGVGPKSAQRLARAGLHTIGDIAALADRKLIELLGEYGPTLGQRARGIDTRPVSTTHHAPKSISQEVTFSRDVGDQRKLLTTLRQQSDRVGRRLRQAKLYATTVKIKLRWPDFTTITRQVSLEQPSNQDNLIYQAARQLFLQNWAKERPVRLLGVGVSGLQAPARQLSLWDTGGVEKQARLQRAVDELKDRFGESTILRGSYLGKRPARERSDLGE